jgi:hypothetical protein
MEASNIAGSRGQYDEALFKADKRKGDVHNND